MASGSDSGEFSVWDLRTWMSTTSPTPAASFKWHQAAVTSLEWSPHDSSMIAVSGEDDQLTLWDLSVEADQEEETITAGVNGTNVKVPAQLIFIHQVPLKSNIVGPKAYQRITLSFSNPRSYCKHCV